MELTEDVIVNSFRIWRRNVKLGIIFFVGTVLSYLPYIVYGLYIYFMSRDTILKIEEIITQSNNLTETQKTLIVNLMLNTLKSHLVEVVVGFILALVFSYLIREYFWCAGIKSCSLALENNLNFNKAFKFAKKKFLTYVAADTLRFLITLAVFVVAAVVAIVTLGILSHPANYQNLDAGKVLDVIFLIIASILIFVVLYFLFIYVPYAVVEGYGVFGSLSASVRTVKSAFFETIVVLIVSLLIAILCSTFGKIVEYLTLFSLNAKTFNSLIASSILKFLVNLILMSFVSTPLNALFLLSIFKRVNE